MRRIIALAALSLGLGLTSLPSAYAQDLQLELGRDGPKLRLRDDCDPRRENCRDDRDRRGESRRECTPDRALNKADRMGVRRARVDRVGSRTIQVRGRTRDGERITVSFGRRDRSCPVLDRYMSG